MRSTADMAIGGLESELRWKAPSEQPRSRLPDIVLSRSPEAETLRRYAAGGDIEDPIFSTHSKLYLRRKEIEEELRREFNLPAEELSPPKARTLPRNGAPSFGHPPPVPHPRPAPRNLPPVPKPGPQQSPQKWGAGGVEEGSVSGQPAVASTSPARQDDEKRVEEPWWRREQQELERRRNLRSTTPDSLQTGDHDGRSSAEPHHPSRSQSPGPGPPLPQAQARERPHSWRPQQRHTPRKSLHGGDVDEKEQPASVPSVQNPEASEDWQQKPHLQKARELQEEARARRRERQARAAQPEMPQEEPLPPPHPQPGGARGVAAPFQPHPPPPGQGNAPQRQSEEDARRKAHEEKAKELEEIARERRRARVARMAEEARDRQRRQAAEEMAQEWKRREEQKFDEMRQEELRRIQRQADEARQRRKEQEDWEEKFRRKLAEEQKEMNEASFRGPAPRPAPQPAPQPPPQRAPRQSQPSPQPAPQPAPPPAPPPRYTNRKPPPSSFGASQRAASVPVMRNPAMAQSADKAKETMRHAEARALQQLSALQKLPSKDAKHKGYKELLRAWHPDKNPSNAEVATAVFQRLQAERSRLGL